MWVKIETKHFPDRLAIVYISQHNMVDATGIKASNSFSQWFNELNEDILKNLLSIFYNNVEDWQIHCISFNYMYMTYDVVVSCNKFDQISFGSQLKRIEPDKEFIKPTDEIN